MDIELIINFAIGYLLAATVIGLWHKIKLTIFMIKMEAEKDDRN